MTSDNRIDRNIGSCASGLCNDFVSARCNLPRESLTGVSIYQRDPFPASKTTSQSLLAGDVANLYDVDVVPPIQIASGSRVDRSFGSCASSLYNDFVSACCRAKV